MLKVVSLPTGGIVTLGTIFTKLLLNVAEGFLVATGTGVRKQFIQSGLMTFFTSDRQMLPREREIGIVVIELVKVIDLRLRSFMFGMADQAFSGLVH